MIDSGGPDGRRSPPLLAFEARHAPVSSQPDLCGPARPRLAGVLLAPCARGVVRQPGRCYGIAASVRPASPRARSRGALRRVSPGKRLPPDAPARSARLRRRPLRVLRVPAGPGDRRRLRSVDVDSGNRRRHPAAARPDACVGGIVPADGFVLGHVLPSATGCPSPLMLRGAELTQRYLALLLRRLAAMRASSIRRGPCR